MSACLESVAVLLIGLLSVSHGFEYALTNLSLVGTNTKAAQSTEGQRLTKIDRENEVAPPPKVDLSVGKAIAKARAEKTPPWKQSDLAQKVNEKPSVINDYENGKAIPNQQILAKMERSLGVKLRGKDIGSKLEDKHAKK